MFFTNRLLICSWKSVRWIFTIPPYPGKWFINRTSFCGHLQKLAERVSPVYVGRRISWIRQNTTGAFVPRILNKQYSADFLSPTRHEKSTYTTLYEQIRQYFILKASKIPCVMSRIVHSSTFTEKTTTPAHSTYKHNIIVIFGAVNYFKNLIPKLF